MGEQKRKLEWQIRNGLTFERMLRTSGLPEPQAKRLWDKVTKKMVWDILNEDNKT